MRIITEHDRRSLPEAVSCFRKARRVVALTGAGISVESGIDDFRSPGGLWAKYPPQEFGTLEVFENDPEKAWLLFRVLGRGLLDKKPNPAHRALAALESLGVLKGIVTQNIDNLHQDAGSKKVIEIHGDHRHLQCIACGDLSEADPALLEEDILPRCRQCRQVLKPNVVLFGENVRSLDTIQDLLHRCDLLMVIGTSAQVYPAASLPSQVKAMGGIIFEFNTAATDLTSGTMSLGAKTDYFFHGGAGKMLGLFLKGLEETLAG